MNNKQSLRSDDLKQSLRSDDLKQPDGQAKDPQLDKALELLE